MKLNFRKVLATVAVGSVALVGLAGTAGAADAIPSSGQDNVNDNFLVGGSDTTYVVDSDLASLYNRSPGCTTQNSYGGSPALGSCLTPNNSAPLVNTKTNWDHDVATEIYPTGSGGGINAVIAPSSPYDVARSSRKLSTTELVDANSWAYGKDGVVVVTPPGRAVTSLTQAQVAGIYACTITTWNQITGNASDTGTIHAYGMNDKSGTYSTFSDILVAAGGGAPNNGLCVEKLGTGASAAYPFENDLKPVLADATAKGFVTSDIIWWGSFGEFKTYPYKSQGVSNWSIDSGAGPVAAQTGTIANDTYGITRFLYRVAKNATVGLTGTNAANTVLSTTGATAGKAGAARRFIEFGCQPLSYFDATTALNPFFGTSYYADQTAAIERSGFQRVPGAQRNAGACKVQQ